MVGGFGGIFVPLVDVHICNARHFSRQNQKQKRGFCFAFALSLQKIGCGSALTHLWGYLFAGFALSGSHNQLNY